MACSYIPADAGNLSGLVAYFDCQAQTIGATGYLALAAPGSAVSIALTGLLTILIALFGYRLLLGPSVGLRDGVLTVVRIGIVLTLATSWPAYRILVYDLALLEPAELATSISGAAMLPGATGDLAGRLDGIDQQFQALEVAGIGAAPSGPQSGIAQPAFAGSDSFALAAARITFLTSSVGSFAVVRLVAGLLLAVGPLFVSFLLLDAMRGLFIGWLRALVATALGATAIAVVLGVELVVLEPWLAELVARRSANITIAAVPPQLFAVTLVFAGVLAAALRMAASVTAGLTSMLRGQATFVSTSAAAAERTSQQSIYTGPSTIVPTASDRPRVSAIVDAVSATERREAALLMGSAGGSTAGVSQPFARSTTAASASFASSETLRVASRRSSQRVSAGAQRRDRL